MTKLKVDVVVVGAGIAGASVAAVLAPVVGHEPDAQGFFWLAGQGGYGIQTAPAMAALAAALVVGGPVPAALADFGVEAGALRPDRF